MPKSTFKFKVKLIILLCILWIIYKLIYATKTSKPIDTEKLVFRDWYDYKAKYYDARRVGLGEHGKAAVLTGDVDRNLEKRLLEVYGINVLLSDAISLNRSVSGVPFSACQHKKYLAKLPAVSIVIPFYNEYLSVLLRSVHSLINRTPPELLKEIILVDDFSDWIYLGKQLDQYVARHFDKVQIIRLTKRSGLIQARLSGLRKATAKVLVVFDSHIEVNDNWLPPLLEPIALNKRTVVCPIVDRINYENFRYEYEGDGLGGFDWTFMFVQLQLLPENLKDKSKNYENPVMSGGLFAISAEFFWELGGYDEGLQIWGGEQYELSFKIWMCGGQLLNVPCSRVGHLFRNPNAVKGAPNELRRNYKRVAEVWMDEYKNYIYERANGVYEKIDAGDLSNQKALREKLQCKSFKWYLEEIAYIQLKFYPPVEPQDYAYGAIQNIGFPSLCIDTLNKPMHSSPGLYSCAKNLSSPQGNQLFALTFRHDLRHRNPTFCFDVFNNQQKNAPVYMYYCHGHGKNQFWFYDRRTKWLRHGNEGKYCLEASPSNREVIVNACQNDNLNMHWNFGVVNDKALDRFFDNLNT